MSFRNLVEDKEWYLFGPTVTLYHGTSSALLPKIKSEGLKPPDETMKEFSRKLLRAYGVDNDEIDPLADQVNRIISFRFNSEDKPKTADVVYLSTSFKQAKGYADSYFMFGGEIASDVWATINQLEAKKQRVKFDRKYPLIEPIYFNARPVVVEVEVPHNWMITYYDLKDRYQKAILYWNRFEKNTYHGDFAKYLNDAIGKIEVRVPEIPTNLIKTIHEQPRPSTVGPES